MVVVDLPSTESAPCLTKTQIRQIFQQEIRRAALQLNREAFPITPHKDLGVPRTPYYTSGLDEKGGESEPGVS